jgi:DNA-binding NarL/FixJ family response regulator
VLLVTQVRLYAEGIVRALDELDAIGRVAVALNCDAAIELLARDPSDVVVLDLAGIDDAAAAQALVQAVPSRVVALAVREHDQDIVAWAERGAMGIVTRQASFDDLLHAILAAARGECCCSPRVATALMRRVAGVAAERRRVTAPHAALTLRERQIVELLIEGLSNKEIAARLLLGVSTVKNHVHSVLRKLDARTRSEAVAVLTEMKIRTAPAPGPDLTAA